MIDKIKMENNIDKMDKIVFYDGDCGLCNYFVNLLLDLDKNNILRFSPLQGQKAVELLPIKFREKLNTLVFIENDKFYTESDAVLNILYSIGGIWKLFYVLMIIPEFIRNAVYAFISRNRIRWFGTTDNCRFPSAEDKLKFID